MDSRHGGLTLFFSQLTFGAWIVSALGLTGAGCIPGTVSGANVPDGGTINVQLLACSQTPSGCLCVSRDNQPDDVTSCSTSSVATHSGEQGACCNSADLCACDSYACKTDSTLGLCQCSATADIPDTLTGAAANACPTPAADQKCCMAMDAKICVCSASDCDSGSKSVPNCTIALVATCSGDQTSAPSCK